MEIHAACKSDYESVKALTQLSLFRKFDPRKRFLVCMVVCAALTVRLIWDLVIFRDAPRYYPIDPAGLLVTNENGGMTMEDFRHEQYLLIRENGKVICISGCSHKGILNITRWADPDVLVGGFHFMNIDPQGPERTRLNQAALALLKSKATFYTGHCTGLAPYAYLEEIMGPRLHYISTGTQLQL